MENKKFIIITIVLFLLAGTGTFVFAGQERNESGENTFIEEDINYKKVDEKTGQQVPVINNTTTTENNNNGIITDTTNNDNEATDSTVSGTNSSQTNQSQNNGRNPNRNQGSTSGTTGGTTTPTGSQNSGSSETNQAGSGSNEQKNDKDDNTLNSDQASELTAELNYSTTLPTNQSVTVTITIPENRIIDHLSENDWTISGHIATKTFAVNTTGKKEIVVYDNKSQSKKLEYEINNIDKDIPKLEVSYNDLEKTFRPIRVTIKSNKEIKEVSEKGWEYVNSKEITKTFESNITNTIVVRDLAGNEATTTYNIKNYEDKPIINTEKGENSTTITLTYKEPTKDTDNWEKLDNGEYKASIEIKNSNNKASFSDGSEVIVLISNEESEAVLDPRKPVAVTIIADKELKELDGWTLSTDKKSLTKFVYEYEINKNVLIHDIYGNSATVKYSVYDVDAVLPKIKKISTENGTSEIKVKLNMTENVYISDKSWNSTRDLSKQFWKFYNLNIIEAGVEETLTFTDTVGNVNTIKVKLIYKDGKLESEIINQ